MNARDGHKQYASNLARRVKPIDPNVLRVWTGDTYFGTMDRSVPVVPSRYANEAHLRVYSVPVEEYIAEQLDYRVVGDLLVLNDDGGLEYCSEFGMTIPDEYDNWRPRTPDHVAVHSYDEFLEWAKEGGAA